MLAKTSGASASAWQVCPSKARLSLDFWRRSRQTVGDLRWCHGEPGKGRLTPRSRVNASTSSRYAKNMRRRRDLVADVQHLDRSILLRERGCELVLVGQAVEAAAGPDLDDEGIAARASWGTMPPASQITTTGSSARWSIEPELSRPDALRFHDSSAGRPARRRDDGPPSSRMTSIRNAPGTASTIEVFASRS